MNKRMLFGLGFLIIIVVLISLLMSGELKSKVVQSSTNLARKSLSDSTMGGARKLSDHLFDKYGVNETETDLKLYAEGGSYDEYFPPYSHYEDHFGAKGPKLTNSQFTHYIKEHSPGSNNSVAITPNKQPIKKTPYRHVTKPRIAIGASLLGIGAEVVHHDDHPIHDLVQHKSLK